MEDDFGGPSVWGDVSLESQPPTPALAKTPVVNTTAASAFDEFDDAFADDDEQVFSQAQPAIGGDDFDDFGDFDEGGGDTFTGDNDLDDSPYFDRPVDNTYLLHADWQPLRLNPLPTSGKLAEQIHSVLGPLWEDTDTSTIRDGNIRQVEGVNQTLVSSESRTLYRTLFQTTPSNMQPVDWIRSRIRRRHLVACGIPVNLDEVLPHVNGKAMPALKIITRPLSAPPGPRQMSRNGSPVPATTSNSRAGTPQPTTTQPNAAHADLGPQPHLDRPRITRLLELKPETLPLLPVGTLEAHAASLQSMTESASAVLTYLLQTRDALQQNSETYNGLIAELVSEAQKMKSSTVSRTKSVRRGSGLM